jgi:hypothetical protein
MTYVRKTPNLDLSSPTVTLWRANPEHSLWYQQFKNQYEWLKLFVLNVDPEQIISWWWLSKRRARQWSEIHGATDYLHKVVVPMKDVTFTSFEVWERLISDIRKAENGYFYVAPEAVSECRERFQQNIDKLLLDEQRILHGSIHGIQCIVPYEPANFEARQVGQTKPK